MLLNTSFYDSQQANLDKVSTKQGSQSTSLLFFCPSKLMDAWQLEEYQNN